MKIEIFTVGKIKAGFLSDGEQVYLKRLKHYTSISQSVIKAEKIGQSTNRDVILNKEADRFYDKIKAGDLLVALDKSGNQMTSEQFAKTIQKWQFSGKKRLVFMIGGALGLSSHILKKADFVLSISKMTFQHDMAKLILLEQLYRSYTIINGEKYHK